MTKRNYRAGIHRVQTAVDDKHKLIVTGEVTQDGNDERQLAPMAQAAKAELGVEAVVGLDPFLAARAGSGAGRMEPADAVL